MFSLPGYRVPWSITQLQLNVAVWNSSQHKWHSAQRVSAAVLKHNLLIILQLFSFFSNFLQSFFSQQLINDTVSLQVLQLQFDATTLCRGNIQSQVLMSQQWHHFTFCQFSVSSWSFDLTFHTFRQVKWIRKAACEHRKTNPTDSLHSLRH